MYTYVMMYGNKKTHKYKKIQEKKTNKKTNQLINTYK